MIWKYEWEALAAEISGFAEAVRDLTAGYGVNSGTSTTVIGDWLVPGMTELVDKLCEFGKTHSDVLPDKAVELFNELNSKKRNLAIYGTDNGQWLRIREIVPALLVIRSRINYALSDSSVMATKLVERAFTHLRCLLIADGLVKNAWQDAFKNTEESCEKLGAAHLLSHGIWSFKANGDKGRTDLVLGEPAALATNAARTAEALVLTEWKIVGDKKELKRQIETAYQQARIYTGTVLAGYELRSVRYLVMVSEYDLPPQDPIEDSGCSYRIVNIPVNPKPPSRAAQGLNAAVVTQPHSNQGT